MKTKSKSPKTTTRPTTQTQINYEITVANLADAYFEVAKINHYMVGIVGTYTYDEYHDASQVLINRQNDPKNSTKFNQLELALNVLEMDCQRVHNTKP